MTDLRRTAAGFLALALLCCGVLLHPLVAAAYDDSVTDYAAEILQTVSGGDVQAWLDETLPRQVGQTTPDWYAMALSARGYDVSAYSAALQQYLAENEIPSGSTRERMALALAACEPEPPALCTELLACSAEATGIMSRIFALHLRNNGVPSAQYPIYELAGSLLALQAADGGWSLKGDRGDADVTAMTLQALAPYQDEAAVADAIARGVQFLADTQLSSGAYQSYGTENPESTAQVWMALSALGIDALADSRFIQNGSTLLDGILQFRVDAGAYAHTLGGEANHMATMQVYLALTAAEWQQYGENLLLFYGLPQWDAPAPPVTESTAAAPPAQTTRRTDSVQPADAAAVHTAASAETTAATTAETTQFTDTSAADSSRTAAETTAMPPETESIAFPPESTPSAAPKYPYRLPLTAAAGVIFGGAAVYFVLRKNRSAKTYLTLAGGFVLTTALIWLIRVETPQQFYQSEARSGGGTVTMTIRCDAICGLQGSEAYPADGIILPPTAFPIDTGETALELLYDAVKAYSLQVETDGSEFAETAYVRSIASLYEFDFGDLSGWSYEVNGVRLPVGCGACILQDGDRVEWVYTINL